MILFYSYSTRLKLTALDLSLVRASVLQYSVQECLYGITNACSHQAVLDGLVRLQLYATVFTHYNPGQYLKKSLVQDAVNRYGHGKGMLGAYRTKRIAAGAHRPASRRFKPAKHANESVDYCLGHRSIGSD